MKSNYVKPFPPPFGWHPRNRNRTIIAGPFAGCMLGYFGAEVIKIAPPESGEPIRGWRVVEDGTSLWWRSLGRNKK